jgi:hypothetical protein
MIVQSRGNCSRLSLADTIGRQLGAPLEVAAEDINRQEIQFVKQVLLDSSVLD